MDTIKIFLEKMRSKQSSNTSGGLNVELKGGRKLLPLNDVADVVSYMEQYTTERENCNKIRLTCQVNPICSNVLFNRITEIVKYEGSDAVTFLNYGEGGDEPFGNNQVVYKPATMEFWSGGNMRYQSVDDVLEGLTSDSDLPVPGSENRLRVTGNGETRISDISHPTNAIRDMQLSRNDDNGDHFVYHCGLDIFNNHLIRSNTFKCISRMPEGFDLEESNYTAFNTIADLMRDAKGEKVIEKLPFPSNAGIPGNAKFLSLHTYLYDDILSFETAKEERLIEKYNGWYGFLNKSKIKSYKDFAENEDLRMERPIMYMSGGDFVDMYPGRDLYSFVPKYNSYRNRMEKNWNYCLTYPSSSTTDGFGDIIEESTNSLKAIYFDENTRTDSGTIQLVIYSKTMHGLKKGDYVNIYNNDNVDGEELIISNAKVEEVADPFIFTTYAQGVQISSQWVEVTEEERHSSFTANGMTYTMTNDGTEGYFRDENNRKYYLVNDKYVNIDLNAQHISYKKVVNGIECDYYVRIFSRLPNFKFASGDTSNEFNIYRKSQNDNSLLEIYQSPKYDFESHLSRLAFAKNIYSDDIGEIVFTDDIDLSNLHDNLGRPLTEIYMTIVKNNAGYKEWYGFDGVDVNINSENVEYSHCFGKVTCGFEMSYESRLEDRTKNIRAINNLGFNSGYTEINFNNDIHFYGDLCCYDNYNAVEQSIQPMLHRFNTAQRESKNAASGNTFLTGLYDEITRDDYDTDNNFLISQYKINECNSKPEGYFYQPHHRIQVKSFGTLNTMMPDFLTMTSFIDNPDGTAQITTLEYHFLSQGDKAMVYDQQNERYYYLTAVPGYGDSPRTFTCQIFDEDGNLSPEGLDGDNAGNYRLFKLDNMNIPSYAHLLKDGTCRYIWRDVINNGSMGGNENLEEYPFTNGAFYVNKKIDMYVRRQDPYDEYGLYSEDDVIGVEVDVDLINEYYNENEIQC